MVFHVRIALSEVDKRPSRSIIAIGETVFIDKDGKPVILTGKIQRKYP
jgi:hypothetical protein